MERGGKEVISVAYVCLMVMMEGMKGEMQS